MYKTNLTSTYSFSRNVQDRSYNLQLLSQCTRQILYQPTATPTMYKTDPTKLGVAGRYVLLKNWTFERKPNCTELLVICYC